MKVVHTSKGMGTGHAKLFQTQVEIIAASPMIAPKISRTFKKTLFFPTQVINMLSSTQLHFSVFNSRYFFAPNFILSQFYPHAYRHHLSCSFFLFFLFSFLY